MCGKIVKYMVIDQVGSQDGWIPANTEDIFLRVYGPRGSRGQ